MSNVSYTLSIFNYNSTRSRPVTISFGSVFSTAAAGTGNSVLQELCYGLNIAVGILGVCANGLLVVLLSRDRKLRSNPCNALILNQRALDLFASFLLALTYTVKLHRPYYADGWTRFYCKMFDNNASLIAGLNGSTSCLMVISFERYMKICHSILHKTRFHTRTQKAALVFPWIYAPVIVFPIAILTSDVANGLCMAVYYWPTIWLQQLYGIGTVIWKFLLPIGVFVVCYAKILHQVREQGRIHVHSTTTTHAAAGKNVLSRSEKKIVMMLLYVAAFYILSYTPLNAYYALYNFNVVSLSNNAYPVLVSSSYLSVCANPIIYAVQYKLLGTAIRRLRRMDVTTNETTVQLD